MAVMKVFNNISLSVWECLRVCEGVRGCARLREGVRGCAGVRRCVRVCEGARGCVRVCELSRRSTRGGADRGGSGGCKSQACLQKYFAHKKQRPPPGPPYGPNQRLTLGT